MITLDGVSGSGKSSTARELARVLGYAYLDTGAMYRALTWSLLQNGCDVHVEADVCRYVERGMDFSFRSGELLYFGRPLSDAIHHQEVSQHVAVLSRYSCVRREMISQQRKLALQAEQGLVAEGRDMGTVVFPEADLKVFMEASLELRGSRRQKQWEKKGVQVSKEDIMKDLAARDEMDTNRTQSPLRKAKDARVLDTSSLNFKEQVDQILRWVCED
ncbi:MAG: (d)CMP kinase [Cytophagales bacterium]|nr:(d)CMP kinase [Cytophagales bacterium]